MNERITYNPEMKRIHEYRKRLVEAINYKGNADHEDVPSILCEFQGKIIKEHTEKVVEQLKAEYKPVIQGRRNGKTLRMGFNGGIARAIEIIKSGGEA